jgi:hypothetical protein
VLEQDALVGQPIQVRGVHQRIAVAAQGVEALLVGAEPEDVRSFGGALVG